MAQDSILITILTMPLELPELSIIRFSSHHQAYKVNILISKAYAFPRDRNSSL